MTLGQLKEYVENLPKDKIFYFKLSRPFSWRGSYNEVAFTIEAGQSNKSELLTWINEALTTKFYGYKDGDYRYYDHTSIHFEGDFSEYTDGEYAMRWLCQLLELEKSDSVEEMLIKLIFPKK